MSLLSLLLMSINIAPQIEKSIIQYWNLNWRCFQDGFISRLVHLRVCSSQLMEGSERIPKTLQAPIWSWQFYNASIDQGLCTKYWYNVVQRKQKRNAKLDLLEKVVSILWPCHSSCQLIMLMDTKLVTTLENEQCHLVNLLKYNNYNPPFYTNLLVVVGIILHLAIMG
jgi:hypothetical protein